MADSKLVIVKTISATVYERLRELILTGYFKPGQWLRERELLEMLGVSRTPVREALRKLEQERLLESIPRRGFRVPVPDVKDIESFYELRAELEGMAAGFAAKRATIEQINAIKETVDAAEGFLKNEASLQVIFENNQFHERIALASHNSALFQALQQLRAEVNLFRVLSWSTRRERPSVTQAQHLGIYEAIRDGDSQLARNRASEHVWDSLLLVREALKQTD